MINVLTARLHIVRKGDSRESIQDRVDAIYALESQANRIAELEAALKPFAEAAEELTDKDQDIWDIWEHHVAQDITVADLRKARKVLGQKVDES